MKIKSSLIVVLVLLLSSLASAAPQADVIIIGAGGAGLAAAVEVAHGGLSAIVLEQNAFVGGNTLISGGAYNAAVPHIQAEQGIEDSTSLHFKQTMAGGDNEADPRLVRILVNNSGDTLRWLQSLGLEMNPNIYQVIGATHPRSNQSIKPSGHGFIEAVHNQAIAAGVDIRLRTKAEELIVENGRVVGTVATLPDGSTAEFYGKAVIIATGGFGANVEMRTRYNSALGENIPTTNLPTIMGSGILMAEKLGAKTIGMDRIQLLALANPESGSVTGAVTISIDNLIFVNQDGHRFVREDGRRDVLADGVLAQEDALFYLINDSRIVGEVNEFGENIERLVEQGRIVKADTLAELAAKLEMPAKNLEASVENFNKAVRGLTDDEFGRERFVQTIEVGPFYGVIRTVGVHHTMGGLAINTNAQVLDLHARPIPGLYAAGEVTGGIHGSNRLGGNAIPDAFVFGRVAAQGVVSELIDSAF